MSFFFIKKILKPKAFTQSDFHSKKIEKIIKYKFNYKSLLFKAFKHRSYLSVTKEDYIDSNERLEFLGDAILGLATTEYLYHIFPNETEGSLSKMKSILVSRPVLADICEALGLGEFLLIDKGEKKTGGKKRTSNLANLFEAIIGAIYLDSNYDKANQFIKKTLLSKSEEILKRKKHYNYKSILLEFSQSKGFGSPAYKVVEENGPDHDKFFVIQVCVDNKKTAKGEGRSKKIAEQNAAKNLINIIQPQLNEK